MSFDLIENIRHHGFKRLLLAVSGGLDSICLAHYFIKNREALGIEWIGIAHVHHGLREGTADRDAKFVEEFAKSHNVPFFLKRLDGEALKAAEGSLEENARDARYKALVDIALDPSTPLHSAQDDKREMPSPYADHAHISAKALSDQRDQVGHDKDPSTTNLRFSAQDDISLVSRLSSFVSYSPIAIVTAHHANDQAETMFMRLKRGTTLAGLRGIQEIRVLSNSKGVAGLASEAPLEGVMEDRAAGCNQGETSPTPKDKSLVSRLSSLVYIFRPFLNVTRSNLLAYARENGLCWCEDESNADVKFARNKIRHEFLPNLERECPGAIRQLCKIAGLADKAYAKVIAKCSRSFDFAQDDSRGFPLGGGNDKDSLVSRPSSFVSLDKKKLNKILREYANADLSELFRLWLSEKGLRFPIGFFYGPKEPAHVKIPVRAVYRRRSIVKIAHTVWICEFKDALSAAKFVSCEKKEKDYNEST
ncbi:ATP-binding protein [Fibrobacter sp. UWB4]|uniref:tRNA lysidine(34) synthetase n=1 Tax=Fibrobacter sp. UWB4 TaxID=1964356 RepID=UPI0020CB72B7|nr:tRNA lysidine(34) synthetase [Fibrobacter sp. UWB4]